MRFVESARLLRALRDAVEVPNGPRVRNAIVDASLVLEAERFAAATGLGAGRAATRRERLDQLRAGVDAIYGAGLVSARERVALEAALARLDGDAVGLAAYKRALDYLALAPGWGTQWLRFHFGSAVRTLETLEPMAPLFLQDQLLGSPLFAWAEGLDALLRDASRLAGVRNELFGKDVGAGVRSLNPGLARGVLRLAPGEGAAFEPDGVYLLPETVADLPPVAGILTRGEGNPISHAQLLARNLGIPNVGVDESLVDRLAPLRAWLDETLPAVPPTSALGRALGYLAPSGRSSCASSTTGASR